MKSKKLLLSTCVMLGGLAAYISLSSNASGAMGVYTSGCGGGGCHGSSSTSTTIELTSTGIVGNKFDYGTTYPMVLKIKNTAMLKAGFDLKFSAGTISNTPTNTMVMGTELHHYNTPFTMNAGEAVINFNWTAPTSAVAQVSVSVAANAVNGDNGSSGDAWNLASFTFIPNIPASTADLIESSYQVYPNPVQENMTIETSESIRSVRAVSLTGAVIELQVQHNGHAYQIATHELSKGMYLLLINNGKKISHKQFIKQ